MRPATDYKALYQSAQQDGARKDGLIVLLQQQLTELASERHSMLALATEQQEQLTHKEAQITLHQQTIEMHLKTISRQDEKLALQQAVIEEQNQLVTAQNRQLEVSRRELVHLNNLRYELKTLKKWIYGIKSEKRYLPSSDAAEVKDPGQLCLDMEIDSWGICKITDRRKVPGHLRVVKTITPKKRGGRHDFPQGLEEEIITVDVPDKPAGARQVGYVDQRQLACDPMRWYIKVTRRLVYLVPVNEDRLNYRQLVGPLPAHPIEKCKMDISILVLLTVEKFLYHMPVWRQQARLERYGIRLSYSTMCALVNRTCEVLEPLWHLLLKEITQSGLMSLDETRYRVIDNTGKRGKKTHIGWMWSALNPVQGIVCFLYQKGRGKKDIHSILQGYKGYLMTDAYGAYTKYGRQPGVIHQHCLSHARRYFITALQNDAARAGYALDRFFAPLYAIEQQCKDLELDYDGITQKRQAESLPLLQAFRGWLGQTLPQTIERSPIHKAISYTLKNYEALVRFTQDGMLPMDNNKLEGQIRAIALGRNSHLFAGSHRGGELAAIMYSFMATCKLQNIDPSRWLDDVLHRVSKVPHENLIRLLPQFWKPLNQHAKTG